MTRGSKALGASLVVVSSFFYGLYGVWAVLMGGAFGDYQQAVFRSIIVVVCLLPFAVWRKKLGRIYWRRDAWWLLASCVSSALIAGPLYYATQRIGVGLSSALLYAGVVLGMFCFGWLFSRERYTKEKFAATILSFVGLALIFSPSVRNLGFLALLAALLSGFATSLNVVASQKMPYCASQTTIITWTGGILANLLMMALFGEFSHRLTFDIHWLYLVLYSFTSIAASWTVIRGVKLIDAGSAGILGLLEIVFGVVFGVIFFAERPSALVLLGMAAVLLAAAIPYVHHFKLKDEPFELKTS